MKCKECTHFVPDEFNPDFGECELMEDANKYEDKPGEKVTSQAYGYDYEGYKAGVEVGEDFGCIHFCKRGSKGGKGMKILNNSLDRLLKRIRTVWGKSVGYGSCSHCNRTWDCVEPKGIRYSETGGMFPLCKECFYKLEIEQVENYIDQLVKEWTELGWNQYKSPSAVIRDATFEAGRMKRR